MDKDAAKLLLESYRPRDADDPIFAEALREVAADPELAAWFKDTQRFDALMSEKLQEMPVPTDLRNHILLGPGCLEGDSIPALAHHGDCRCAGRHARTDAFFVAPLRTGGGPDESSREAGRCFHDADATAAVCLLRSRGGRRLD